MKPRILYVVHSLPIAGTELLVYQLALANKKKYEVAICCLDGKGPLAKYLEAEKIPVFEMLRQPGRDWGIVKRMSHLIDTFSPDIIHAHQYTPFFYSALAKSRRAKLVFTEHGRHYPDVVGIKRKIFNQWAQFRAHSITAVCEFSKQRIHTKEWIWARKTDVIYNGVSVKPVQTLQSEKLRKELNISKKSTVIGFVGRLHSIKNPELLFNAFSTLVSKFPKLHLLYIGDGELREKLEKQVKKKKLNKKVTFVGSKYPVDPYYVTMDLLVLPSESEGASVTLLEAMAAKVPVIASNVGGNAEFVENKVTGRIFRSTDKKHLIRLISKFLNKPEKYNQYAINAYKDVKEKYNQDKMFKEYRELYEELV